MFPYPRCLRTDWREFDHYTEELQKRFLLSNLKTANFVSLLKVCPTPQGSLFLILSI